MKKFFTFTKYLWFGGFIGLLQQFLGDLDNIKYQGNTIIDFAVIFVGLSIYAAIILLVIRRDVPPKQQFRDLILFFIGLDLFYYLYTFFIRIYFLMVDPMIEDGLYQSLTAYEFGDFIYWTTIGLAASVWAFVATKLRNSDKKVLYIIMLIPLFSVIVLELVTGTISTIMFFITGGGSIPIPGETGYTIYECAIITVLTSLVSLIVCLYKFLKKPNVKKINEQEA